MARPILSRVIAGLAVFASVGWFAWIRVLPGEKPLEVTFLDVGQGDSIVVATPGNHPLVVDTGRSSGDDDAGRSIVLPFLRSKGLNSIDALLLTHPDDDHIGGAISILERIRVGRLLVSGIPSDAPNYVRTLDTAIKRHVPIVHLARGQLLDFHDSVTAEVLNPPTNGPPSRNHRDNNGCLVVLIRRQDTSILLTGDAEVEAEQDMLSDGEDLHADVLKLGHHGSKTSSSNEFLDSVKPKVAIVSAGIRNVFGHPNPLVMERVESRGIKIFRTGRDGAITVSSDVHKLTFTHLRQGARK